MVDTAAPTGVGSFRIVAPIGVGSSSIVYRVVDELDGTEAALKVLADNLSMVPEMRQRFLDEATLLAAVEHPGLAEVLAVGETDRGQPYLALELANRGDLRSRFDEATAAGLVVDEVEVLTLGRQLAAALGALHDAGIVHRDVTPANILIRDDATSGPGAEGDRPVETRWLLGPGERFLIADLGLAKDLAFASGLTAGGGTPGFAAPEQREALSVIDHRCDVYGATAVLRWAVAGSPLEGRLGSFLAVGLAEDPERRHPSMAAWLEDLTEALASGATSSPRPRPRLGREGRLWPRPRRRVALAAVGGTVALLGLATALLAGIIPTAGPDESTGLPTDGDAAAPSAPSTIEVPATEAPAVSAPGTGPSPSSSPTSGPAAGPTNPSSIATSPSMTSTTTMTSTTVALTPPTVATLAPTTTEARFAGSPRAYVDRPTDGAVVSPEGSPDGLVIGGVARYDEGVASVRLVVRNLDTGVHWHPAPGSWETEWLRFELPVEPVGGTEATWQATIPSDQLDPGRYLIRVWAVATAGNGDPVSDVVSIEVRR